MIKTILKRGAVVTAVAGIALSAFASTASAAPGVHSLKYGSKGTGVTCIQAVINWTQKSQGYHVDVDGVWGKATQQGVINFQRAHNLKPDGIVGPATGDLIWMNVYENPGDIPTSWITPCYDALPTADHH